MLAAFFGKPSFRADQRINYPIAKEGCGTLTESQQRRNRPVAVSPLGLRCWSSLFRPWSEHIFLQPALRAQHLVVHEPSEPHLAAGQVVLRLAFG
jgi:hypothetical protein